MNPVRHGGPVEVFMRFFRTDFHCNQCFMMGSGEYECEDPRLTCGFLFQVQLWPEVIIRLGRADQHQSHSGAVTARWWSWATE